jgi:serine/threonine protein kinase
MTLIRASFSLSPKFDRLELVGHQTALSSPKQSRRQASPSGMDMIKTVTGNHPSSVLRLSPDMILQGRYRVVRELGSGGMGAVYEAIDLRLGHTVAIKHALTKEEGLWKQFESEARLMAQLNHPVLPRVSDYFKEGDRAFFVMQFVEGANLAEIIAQRREPLPSHTVVAWADQLLDALMYLHSHERQVIHRDIKPHNLKITPAGKIVLLDFGLAKSQAKGVTEMELCRSIFGFSPRYAPLEQIQDLGTTPQSDIYALGATLYHLLTGIKPPDALTRATALINSRPNPLKPAHEVNRSVSYELSAILSRAMEQNPHERYRSAMDFREALRQLGRSEANQRLEFVAQPVPSRTTIAEGGMGTLFSADHTASQSGSRASTVMVMILLAAFGLFCYYYPWRLPELPATDESRKSAAVSPSQSKSKSGNVLDSDKSGDRYTRIRRKVSSETGNGR